MELKIDDHGNVVVQDGQPVYVHSDGSEMPFDAARAMQKIKDLNEESRRHRVSGQDAQKKLDDFMSQFGDIEPAEALKAVETVKALDQKDLVKAAEVEKLKESVKQAYKEKEAEILKAHQTKVDELQGMLDQRTGDIKRMMLKDAFNGSKFFAGEKPATTYAPWEAMEIFGRYFDVEGEGQDARPVGYLNGEKILSKANYVDPAPFDEAIGQIIASDPDRFNKILVTNQGGGGGQGNQGGGAARRIKTGDNQAFIKNLNDIAAGKIKVDM